MIVRLIISVLAHVTFRFGSKERTLFVNYFDEAATAFKVNKWKRPNLKKILDIRLYLMVHWLCLSFQERCTMQLLICNLKPWTWVFPIHWSKAKSREEDVIDFSCQVRYFPVPSPSEVIYRTGESYTHSSLMDIATMMEPDAKTSKGFGLITISQLLFVSMCRLIMDLQPP